MPRNYFFTVNTKHAYFVMGAENAGNRMMVAALVSAGCYGDAGTEQRLDDLDFTDKPERIAFLRSIPHGKDVPDVRGIAMKMRQAGYQVHPILMYRKTDFMLPGQIEADHARHLDEVREHIQMSACMAYDVACCLEEKLVVVVYELFVMLPQIRRRIFHQLGLPEPAIAFFNANEKYEMADPPLAF